MFAVWGMLRFSVFVGIVAWWLLFCLLSELLWSCLVCAACCVGLLLFDYVILRWLFGVWLI